MNLLLALLAFAGIMAFLSTSMSIILEGIHKALSWRRAGLEEVLRTLHNDVLVRLGPSSDAPAPTPGPTRATSEAARFARAMTENVSFGGRGRFWWLRNLPFLSWIFQRRQERLTTLQFVEGFARTQTGRELQALDPARLRRALTVAAYEFERYCDSQAAYFRRRAGVLSVVLSVMFAFIANIDAFYIFERLARDPNLANFVASAASTESTAEPRTETTPANAAAAPTGEAQDQQTLAALQQRADRANEFTRAGVPIGYMAFPYCLEKPVLIETNDARCGDNRTPREASMSEVMRRAWERVAAPGGGGFIWFLSVIVAGGLIGLGAPFWYDFFRRIARMMPLAQRVQTTITSPQQQTGQPGGAEVVRDRAAANPHALVLAYRVASGQAASAAASPELDAPLDPDADVTPVPPGAAGGVQPTRNRGIAFGSATRMRRPL